MSDLYFQASRTKAKPIALIFIGTDYGFRCFGKHTPTSDHIGSTHTPCIDWGPRVYRFGHFRTAASWNSENILQFLSETVMSTYNPIFLNADGYFTKIAAMETLINADLYLYQGFEYPSFAFADFLPIFYGKVQRYEYDYDRFLLFSQQEIIAEPADDPTIDLTVTYGDDYPGGT
jgi:hypothetical protein